MMPDSDRNHTHSTVDESSALDTDDDDVVPSSPRSFYAARSRRNYQIYLQRSNSANWLTHNRRAFQNYTSDLRSSEGEILQRQERAEFTIPNNACYINLVDSDEEAKEKSAPPREEYTCPVCLQPFVESTTTRCGHIFCKECITKAIASQKRCPYCRKRLTKRSIHRVHLPYSR